MEEFEKIVTRNLSKGVPDSSRHDGGHVDHVAHAKPGFKPFPDRLHVIAVVSNPARYRIRYELYRAFEKHVQEAGAILNLVECAFGGRQFEVADPKNPDHVCIRTPHELWIKENMINIAISRLPSDWKYVAWVDADVIFSRPDWCQETLHQLQHFQVVQMFSHAQDIGPNFEPLGRPFESFMSSYIKGRELPYKRDVAANYPYGRAGTAKGGDMQFWHCGYAWAARREAIDSLGGLIDWAILGSADHNMAAALIGTVQSTVHAKVHPNLIKWMKIWEHRAETCVRRNVGYVDGLLLHHWHGKKVNRGYVDRWKVLVENQFDPEKDIKKDSQGLIQLVDHGDVRSIKLKRDIQLYFRSRNEDSIDVE